MPPPPHLTDQFIHQPTVWWVIFDGSGKHHSFAAWVAHGPEWRAVAGRLHGSDNSFLAEIWGCVNLLRLIPYTDEAVILGD